MIALINPAVVPALRVAGALFLVINLLAGAWAWRHRRQLFGPDSTAEGDRPATRQLQAIVLGIPGAMEAGLTSWLFWGSLAFALVVAFVVTVPVNRWMIGRGKVHAVVHAYHH